MKEYEYSYKVKDVKPYIDFCIENDYVKIKEVVQHRKVYENIYNKNIISRITMEDDISIIDFKNISDKNDDLNISNESKSLILDESNKEFFDSMLNTLGFKECADNYRIRYIYKRDNVKFEIDDYSSPNMYVVGIEGERKSVDKVFEELIEINKLYKE